MRRSKIKGGGQETQRTTSSTPYTQYGLPDGATNQRSAAQTNIANMNTTQNTLVSQHGGRKRKKTKSCRKHKKHKSRKIYTIRSRKKTNITKRKINKTRRMYGGDTTRQTVTVPTFPNSGSNVSSINANSSSMQTNSTLLTASSSAGGDCYATGSC